MADVSELGSTGLRRAGGFVIEEFLPQLKHPHGARVYREMRDNDPTVGAILFAIERTIGRLNWTITQGSDSPADIAAAEFIQEAIEDMSDSLDETISSILSMLPFGYSYHEIVYKIRGGDSDDPTRNSKYSDNKIGWRKWAIRAQETLYSWQFDENGQILAYIQMDPATGGFHEVPIDKALLFRVTSNKNNPEGRSLLRNAYRPWYFKKRIEEIEATGIERDLAGMPVALVPSEILSPNASAESKASLAAVTSLVQNIKRNQVEGVVFPSERDEAGNLTYELKLLNSGGARNFDTDKIIGRYNQQIAMSVLADFIFMGHEANGSYALGVSKIDLWIMSVDAIAKNIATTINTQAIPKLLRLNGMTVENLPKLTYGDVGSTDLIALGTYIMNLAQAGAIMPDDSLEAYLREVADLPPADNPEVGMRLPKASPFAPASGTEGE